MFAGVGILLTNRRLLRANLFGKGILIGAVTGVVVAALRFLLDTADIWRPIIFAHVNSVGRILLICALMALFAKILACAVKFDSQVCGSGIPQIKGMLQGRAEMFKPLRLLAVKFFATVMTIGAGMSLGRAGISVQFGAAIGNFFTKKFYGDNPQHESIQGDFLLTAGAGAGLAAIFNAPLAGVIFCIEELRKRFSQEILIVTVTAAVTASFVVKVVFGVRPVFETITRSPLNIPSVMTFPTAEMSEILSAAPLEFVALFMLLGIICGFLGVLFTQALIFSLDVYDRLKIFGTRRFLIPFLLIVPLGIELPQVLGCGNVLVDEILISHLELSLLVTLLVGKILFTLICFGTNAPGGLFLPVLVIGALIGNVFARVGGLLEVLTADWTTLVIIFGMAAFFAAVVKAPVTGAVLILELTGQFGHLFWLIIVAGTAFLVADLCGSEPIFSALLDRSQSKK